MNGDHLFDWTPPDSIEPYDNPLRLWIPSYTDNVRYLVDLTDPDYPGGRCDCIDFRIRIEAPTDAGTTPERLTCIHIRDAIAYLRNKLNEAAAGVHASGESVPTGEVLRGRGMAQEKHGDIGQRIRSLTGGPVDKADRAARKTQPNQNQRR